eukprot:TRINITY_DN4800_c0_g1_i2.p1 TRINITY_DN4800_c0_g1~~TRINITY_DN4800_c0_g1_i2.p1  ORF type:complete len:1147 (+),score=230.75 TRINITY_DN4800_c0_g1_i2:246-3443(+)
MDSMDVGNMGMEASSDLTCAAPRTRARSTKETSSYVQAAGEVFDNGGLTQKKIPEGVNQGSCRNTEASGSVEVLQESKRLSLSKGMDSSLEQCLWDEETHTNLTLAAGSASTVNTGEGESWPVPEYESESGGKSQNIMKVASQDTCSNTYTHASANWDEGCAIVTEQNSKVCLLNSPMADVSAKNGTMVPMLSEQSIVASSINEDGGKNKEQPAVPEQYLSLNGSGQSRKVIEILNANTNIVSRNEVGYGNAKQTVVKPENIETVDLKPEVISESLNMSPCEKVGGKPHKQTPNKADKDSCIVEVLQMSRDLGNRDEHSKLSVTVDSSSEPAENLVRDHKKRSSDNDKKLDIVQNSCEKLLIKTGETRKLHSCADINKTKSSYQKFASFQNNSKKSRIPIHRFNGNSLKRNLFQNSRKIVQRALLNSLKKKGLLCLPIQHSLHGLCLQEKEKPDAIGHEHVQTVSCKDVDLSKRITCNSPVIHDRDDSKSQPLTARRSYGSNSRMKAEKMEGERRLESHDQVIKEQICNLVTGESSRIHRKLLDSGDEAGRICQEGLKGECIDKFRQCEKLHAVGAVGTLKGNDGLKALDSEMEPTVQHDHTVTQDLQNPLACMNCDKHLKISYKLQNMDEVKLVDQRCDERSITTEDMERNEFSSCKDKSVSKPIFTPSMIEKTSLCQESRENCDEGNKSECHKGPSGRKRKSRWDQPKTPYKEKMAPETDKTLLRFDHVKEKQSVTPMPTNGCLEGREGTFHSHGKSLMPEMKAPKNDGRGIRVGIEVSSSGPSRNTSDSRAKQPSSNRFFVPHVGIQQNSACPVRPNFPAVSPSRGMPPPQSSGLTQPIKMVMGHIMKPGNLQPNLPLSYGIPWPLLQNLGRSCNQISDFVNIPTLATSPAPVVNRSCRPCIGPPSTGRTTGSIPRPQCQMAANIVCPSTQQAPHPLQNGLQQTSQLHPAQSVGHCFLTIPSYVEAEPPVPGLSPRTSSEPQCNNWATKKRQKPTFGQAMRSEKKVWKNRRPHVGGLARNNGNLNKNQRGFYSQRKAPVVKPSWKGRFPSNFQQSHGQQCTL